MFLGKSQVRQGMLERYRGKYQKANIQGLAKVMRAAGQELPVMDAQVRKFSQTYVLKYAFSECNCSREILASRRDLHCILCSHSRESSPVPQMQTTSCLKAQEESGRQLENCTHVVLQ